MLQNWNGYCLLRLNITENYPNTQLLSISSIKARKRSLAKGGCFVGWISVPQTMSSGNDENVLHVYENGGFCAQENLPTNTRTHINTTRNGKWIHTINTHKQKRGFDVSLYRLFYYMFFEHGQTITEKMKLSSKLIDWVTW